jgi:hypothetical protein
MRKTDRYWIEIKDAKGAIVLSTAVDWNGDERRVAVAKILRLDGVLDSTSAPTECSGQDGRRNIDVDRMGASLAVVTPAKKKPRH